MSHFHHNATRNSVRSVPGSDCQRAGGRFYNSSIGSPVAFPANGDKNGSSESTLAQTTASPFRLLVVEAGQPGDSPVGGELDEVDPGEGLPRPECRAPAEPGPVAEDIRSAADDRHPRVLL